MRVDRGLARGTYLCMGIGRFEMSGVGLEHKGCGYGAVVWVLRGGGCEICDVWHISSDF